MDRRVCASIVGRRVLLATGSWDRTVRLWDPATGTPTGDPLTGHTAAVAAVAFGQLADGSPPRTQSRSAPLIAPLIYFAKTG